MEPEKTPKSIDGVTRSHAPRRVPPQPPTQPADENKSPEPEAADITPARADESFADIDLGQIDPQVTQEATENSRWYQLIERFKRFKKRHPEHFTRKRMAVYGASLFASILVVAGLWVWFVSNQVIVRDGDGALALQGDVDPTQLRGEGDGRVNILLIGIGGDSHKAGQLADTIILASLDPFAKDVALLSIPRDLWVDIPGYGSSKINAAHAFGEQYNYPGGGPALLSKTIEQILDVPVHYFARVDFTGFKQAVDTVGGVEVNVDQTINDHAFPDQQLRGYEPFYIEAGRQYLDGETALKYARSRYTTSDFDRGKRQRQLLEALKDKALSLGTLANPLKISSLINATGRHVRTDLQVNEIMKLVEIAKEVGNEQVLSYGLDNSPDNYLASSNVGGASALVPRAGDFSEIQKFVRSIFVDGFIKDEAAKIEVLNGTAKTGLGTQTSDLLKSFGYNVIKVDQADNSSYTNTVIYDYSGGAKPYTVRYLEQRFGVQAESATREPGDNSEAEITVIVGGDYTPQQ